MGASASTIYNKSGSLGLRFVPVVDIMEQVHACLVPAERDFLLACLDEIHRRCNSFMGGKKQAAAFHEQGAVEALMEMLGMFKLDEVFLRQVISTLVPLCAQDEVILDHFLDLGGKDALHETLEMHKVDQYIMESGTMMNAIIRRYAKGVAKRDAKRVTKACRYCHTCRPLVDCPDLLGSAAGSRSCADRASFGRTVGSSNSNSNRLVYRGRQGHDGRKEEDGGGYEDDEVLDPVADDLARIQRLLEHMEKFPKILDVVEPCVDALIAVGKSASTEAMVESKCVWRLIKAMEMFPKARSLQWKGLLAIIHLGKKNELCFDLGKAGAVQLLVVMWPKWDDDEMRQLILWALNEVARVETNQLRMQAERVGAMLRETMEPAPARLAATGVMVTAEQAGHYCIPVKLKRLYRQRKLGSPFAREELEDAAAKGKVLDLGPPKHKALFGRVGDDWGQGEAGLV